MDDLIKQINQNRLDRRVDQGYLDFGLEIFGDHLAVDHEYSDLAGIEALQFYLMKKHNWLPRDVRAMSLDDIRFALSEELSGWTLPDGYPTKVTGE